MDNKQPVILVVEDDDDIRELVAFSLEEEGYRIEKQEALVLRSEGGKPVDGLIYRAEKSSL